MSAKYVAGTMLWYSNNGASVKPLVVAESCTDLAGPCVYVRHPEASKESSWLCHEQSLFETEKEALEHACKCCTEDIAYNDNEIQRLYRQNRMIERQLDRFRKRLKQLKKRKGS